MVLAALLAANPVSAGEAFEGQGYLLSCGDEGCFVNSSGFDLFVPSDHGADMLAGLPLLAAVSIRGTLSEMGDSSAVLWLEDMVRLEDDIYEGNLLSMQGTWRPLDDGDAFSIAVSGMEWIEMLHSEVQDRFMISAGEGCADGTVRNGMTVSLYRYGDDPSEDACWLLEQIDEDRMTLRDLRGDFGAVEWERVTD